MFGLAQPPSVYQGYAEGEYVLMASQIAGQIDQLHVVRGKNVKKGDVLFTLEHVAEQAALDQAKALAERANAALADLIKGKRQPEIDELTAQRDQAKAALQIAQITVNRDLQQIKSNAISKATVDADRAVLEQARGRLAETEAALAVGQASVGRDDAIRAALADTVANKAAVTSAQWRLDQKKAVAPADAFVFDTLYREGEYVNAGQPVVSLLPASNIKVRFFVPGTVLPNIKLGSKVSIDDGAHDSMSAHVSYISPQA